MTDTLAKLQVLIRDLGSVTANVTLEPTQELRGVDVGIDSLDAMALLMDIEDEWDIGIPDEEYTEWKTVQDVIDTIERRLP